VKPDGGAFSAAPKRFVFMHEEAVFLMIVRYLASFCACDAPIAALTSCGTD
jgi:hypothetical protein